MTIARALVALLFLAWTANGSAQGVASKRNGMSMNRHADAEKLSSLAVRCIRD